MRLAQSYIWVISQLVGPDLVIYGEDSQERGKYISTVLTGTCPCPTFVGLDTACSSVGLAFQVDAMSRSRGVRRRSGSGWQKGNRRIWHVCERRDV